MKVLHVVPSLASRSGGPTQAVLGLAQEMARIGHRVTVYTTDVDGQQSLLRLKAQVTGIPTGRSTELDGVEIWRFATTFPSRWVMSPELGRALRENVADYDVVHIHSLYQFSTLAASYYARRAGVPYLVRPHGTLDPFLRRRGSLKKSVYEALIERRTLNAAAAIHYTAEDEMRLAASLGIQAPAVIVPLGIDLEQFADLPVRGTFRRQHAELANKRILLFLGRLHFKKGLGLLVEAFARIASDLPDVHLVLVGPDDTGEGDKLRHRLLQAGLEQRALFTGMLTGRDRLAAFVDADLWVLPSYTENFGLAILEAMACSLPIVISDRVNIWREIADARAGRVVPCEIGALATALHQLFEDYPLRRVMGIRARRLVEDRFTWARAAQRMAEVYEQLIMTGQVRGKIA